MTHSFFVASNKLPISIIPSYSCLIQTFQSTSKHLTQQELIMQAYKTHLLDVKQTYLSYSFYQQLTQEYISFFAIPSPKTNLCTLDILLPTCINQEALACIFLSKTKNYFCFYQNSHLVFYKEFHDNLTTCLKHIEVCFSYPLNEVYCLCFNENKLLHSLQSQYTILPLLSLFDHHLGFDFSSITMPISLPTFHNINPQKPKNQSSYLKIFTIIIASCLLFFSLISLGLYFYQSHLANTLDNIHDTSPPSSFSQDLELLSSQNQAMLSSLYEFSLLERQKLLALNSLLPNLQTQNIVSIKLEHSKMAIALKNTPNIATLLTRIHSPNYRYKTFKQDEIVVLEILEI